MSHRPHLAASLTTSTFAATSTVTRAADRLRPLKCVGNWQLTALAARGALTEIYLAKPLGCRADWPADYAVKLLPDERANDPLAVAALVREAEVGSQVSQTHLVPILETHIEQAPYFVVMPKLEGTSVGRVLAEVGRFTTRQALWITRQVAEALTALHEAQWLHGDVKPDNIMISAKGHATLVDFGFTLHMREAMLANRPTTSGTLNYMPPEVMTSAYCADQRSDVYSLGITLFQMLTGRLPFRGRDAAELVDQHRRTPLPDPRDLRDDVPAEVATLLKRMCAKQPIRRPRNTGELIDQLMPLEVNAMYAERDLPHAVRAADATAIRPSP